MTEPNSPPLADLLAHRVWVRNLARTLVRDAASVDDVEQQIWLAALRSPPADRGRPRAWLATVARNVVRRLHRGGLRRHQRETVAAARASRNIDSPDDLVARAETHRAVVDAVLALPESQRRVVLLRYFEGLPVAEVAVQVGVPLETARSRLRIARDRLRATLAPDVATARSLGLFALVATGVGATTSAASAGTAGISTFPALTGVAVMSTTLKVTIAVTAAILVALGSVFWADGRRDAHDAEVVELRMEVARLTGELADAESELRRRPPGDAPSGAGVGTGVARVNPGEEESVGTANTTQNREPDRDPDTSATQEAAARAERRRAEAAKQADDGHAEWRARVAQALKTDPDSRDHAWAVNELRQALLGDMEAPVWGFVVSTIDTAARNGNIGSTEAMELERAYRDAPADSAAAAYLAAATAAGWRDDPRLDGFLAGIPTGDRKSVHENLLRTLDHHPTPAFSRYVARLVRDEKDEGVLRSVFDEDRVRAAMKPDGLAHEIVDAYATRVRDPALPSRLREEAYAALAFTGLTSPDAAAAALRGLAAGLRADDEWRKPLERAADLLQSGNATAKKLEDLFD